MSIRIRVYPQHSSPAYQARRRALRARKMRQARIRQQRALQRYLIQQQMFQQTLGCSRPMKGCGPQRPYFAPQQPPPPPSSGYGTAWTGALPYQTPFQNSAWQRPYAGYQYQAPWQSPVTPWASPASNGGFWGSIGNLFGF